MATSHLRRQLDLTQLNCWVELRRHRRCKLAISEQKCIVFKNIAKQ